MPRVSREQPAGPQPEAEASGASPLEEALASYERQRNEATAETYETTIQFAHLAPPPPEMEPLFAALRDNEEETGRFFGTVNGTVSAADFFAPENIARIVGESRPSHASPSLPSATRAQAGFAADAIALPHLDAHPEGPPPASTRLRVARPIAPATRVRR